MSKLLINLFAVVYPAHATSILVALNLNITHRLPVGILLLYHHPGTPPAYLQRLGVYKVYYSLVLY